MELGGDDRTDAALHICTRPVVWVAAAALAAGRFNTLIPLGVPNLTPLCLGCLLASSLLPSTHAGCQPQPCCH